MLNWKRSKKEKKRDRQQKLICLSNLARTDKIGAGGGESAWWKGDLVLCSRHGDALEKNVLDSERERERERERKREKVYIGGSRLVAVLQRRSRVLLTSPKTKCKLTRRPLDVYSAPRIPPREIRESFSLSLSFSLRLITTVLASFYRWNVIVVSSEFL